MRAPWVLTAVVALAPAIASAEPCPVFGLRPVVETPAGAAIASDGGFVVGLRSRPGDDGSIAGWKLRAGGAPAAPTADEIAPGLTVLRIPPKATEAILLDDKGKQVAKAKVVPGAPTTMAAPRVIGIVSGTSRAVHPTTFVVVELDGAPPDDALALVVADPTGVARSWGPVMGKMSRVAVYDTQSGCGTHPAGTILSRPGDKVVAFWVDARGHRSPVTPRIVVDAPRR
ncbi:MAG: hypothetical protein KF773_40100 [Deltaproteobacteria bacterium]|nr:hypothetical protein [Deltaproteobacteria bacterium]